MSRQKHPGAGERAVRPKDAFLPAEKTSRRSPCAQLSVRLCTLRVQHSHCTTGKWPPPPVGAIFFAHINRKVLKQIVNGRRVAATLASSCSSRRGSSASGQKSSCCRPRFFDDRGRCYLAFRITDFGSRGSRILHGSVHHEYCVGEAERRRVVERPFANSCWLWWFVERYDAQCCGLELIGILAVFARQAQDRVRKS